MGTRSARSWLSEQDDTLSDDTTVTKKKKNPKSNTIVSRYCTLLTRTVYKTRVVCVGGGGEGNKNNTLNERRTNIIYFDAATGSCNVSAAATIG